MYVAKTKGLISCVATVQLICTIVFAYAKSRFTHENSLKSMIYPNAWHDFRRNSINLIKLVIEIKIL